MGSYYKHTRTESAKVPYSFRCEQCMKDSGTRQATIVGNEAVHNSMSRKISQKEEANMQKEAFQKLKNALQEAYENAEGKHIYAKEFNDICPHCGKPQSWAVSGVKSGMFSTPIVCVILGIILGAGCYFFSGVENNLMIALAAAGICVVIGAGILVLNMIKLGNKKKQTAGVVQKNEPVIVWNDVQHILNER